MAEPTPNSAVGATPAVYAPTLNSDAPRIEITERDLLVPSMPSWDAVFRQSFWYAGFNPDQLTTQKRFDVYDEMLTMAACRAPMNVLRYGVLRKGWKVAAAVTDPMDPRSGPAKDYADALSFALSNIDDVDRPNATEYVQDFRQVLYNAASAGWYGFHAAEKLWRMIRGGPYDGLLGFGMFAPKPQKMIGFDLDAATLAPVNLVPYAPHTGFGPPIPIGKALLYTHDIGTAGLPHGNGRGRIAYKHWFLLDKTYQFWAVAVQRGGVAVTAKYPAGEAGAMQAAQQALEKYMTGGTFVIPNNVVLELLALAEGAGGIFKTKADHHTQQIAYGVLGNTLTTGEGERSGSLALGQVHQDTGQDVEGWMRNDLEQITYLQIARPFIRYNFGEAALALCPTISLGEYDQEDRKATAEMYGNLIDHGVTHKRAKYIREDLGLPPLDPDEQKMLDEEDKARQEAEERVADARLSQKGASAGGVSNAD